MAIRGKTTRGPVDWVEIRRRVDAAGRALAGVTAAAPEQDRALLEERARALARPITAVSPAEKIEAVIVALANERYAIESRFVVEVFRLRDLTPLPGAKPPVFGITAWRGDLLTIVDLRPALGLPVTALNDLSRVIVLGVDRPLFGVLADAVQDLITLSAADVRAPAEGVSAKRDYVRGMTTDAVLVLDGARVLRLLHAEGS